MLENTKISQKRRQRTSREVWGVLSWSWDEPWFRWCCRSLFTQSWAEIAAKTSWRSLSLSSPRDGRDPPGENRGAGIQHRGEPCRASPQLLPGLWEGSCTLKTGSRIPNHRSPASRDYWLVWGLRFLSTFLWMGRQENKQKQNQKRDECNSWDGFRAWTIQEIKSKCPLLALEREMGLRAGRVQRGGKGCETIQRKRSQ